MKHSVAVIQSVIAAVTLSIVLTAWSCGSIDHTAHAQAAGPCGLAQPAFCDTFDSPFPVVSRTGQLDPSKWVVSHVNTTVAESDMNQWAVATAMHCKIQQPGVFPPNDYFMCGPEFGESMHLMETLNDDGNYIYNSEMILQPFDFTNRTGTIAFDVDAKNSGSHGWWIELWITRDPVPGPHDDPGHVANQIDNNAVGLFFQDDCLGRGGVANPGEIGSGVTGMNRIQIARNGVVGDQAVNELLCFPTEPDMKNHIEVRLNQNHLEVWASDPQMGQNVQMVSVADGLNLDFSRGFVHFQDSHYDAEKAFNCGCVSETITYHWDNIGFDGPVLPTPRHVQVPDRLASWGDGAHEDLGYRIPNTSWGDPPLAITIPNVDLSGVTAATLGMNLYSTQDDTAFYRLNGGPWHSAPAPGNWATGAFPVSLSELKPGNNLLEFQPTWHVWSVANIDLLLSTSAAVSTNTPIPTSTATATSTLTPTATPAQTSTPTATPTVATATPTLTNTPTPTLTPTPATATLTPTVSATSTAAPTSTVSATSVSLNPGQSVTVVCSGSQLSNHRVSPDEEVLRCS